VGAEGVQRGVLTHATVALQHGKFHNFVGAAAPTVGYVAPPDYLAALLARLIVLMVRRRSWGQRSGLQDSVACALCSQGIETIDHLLLAPGVMVASLSEVRGQSLTQSF
jgi:hypothetical protein